MTKQELKEKFAIECTEINVSGTIIVKGTPMEIIDWVYTVILTTIAEAEQGKWKPYPCPEMLNGESLYLVTLPADQSVHAAYAMSFEVLNVSAYQKLPEPYKESEGTK